MGWAPRAASTVAVTVGLAIAGLAAQGGAASAQTGGVDGGSCEASLDVQASISTPVLGLFGDALIGAQCPAGPSSASPPGSSAPGVRQPRSADTKPPGMPVVKGELVSHAGSIQCTVTAEVGSTLEVSSNVAGEVLSVAATGEPQELTFDLPIGAHALSIVAVDDAGNVSLASTADVEVTAPSAPRLHLLPSDPTMSLRLQVEGTDAASTRVTLSDGQVVEAFLDAAGTTVAEFAVPDGHYTIEVIVADRRGTPSVSSHLETDIVAGTVGDQGQPIPEASVDTVGPRLSVRVAKHAAEAGKLKLAIHAEAGAKVRVRSAKLDLEKRFLARSAAKTFKKQLDEGKYRFTVSATDAAGNLTIRHAKVTIA